MSADSVIDMLRASKEERLPITVYVQGSQIEGVVTQIETGTIQLNNKGERIVIYTHKIDGVSLNHANVPHGHFLRQSSEPDSAS